MAQPAAEPYKTCNLCRRSWASLADLVRDPELVVLGYQPVFEEAERGMVLLNHERPGCRTSLALPAGELRCLYPGEVPTRLMAGEDACPGHCLTADSLANCTNPCRLAWVRQVLQCLLRHELPPEAAGRRVEVGDA